MHNATATVSLRPVELLLVEDDPVDVRLTIESLREGKLANRLHVVPDGVQAMQFLRKQALFINADRPDLVLLDLNLPRLDGRQVLAEMRGEPELRTIPVAIVSGSTREEDVQLAQRFEVTCYLSKPIDVDQLIKVVTLVQGFGITVISMDGRTIADDAVAG